MSSTKLGDFVGTSFDVIDALDGFFALTHRSPTLEGNLPLRAVQYCTPVIEGTAAGVQIETTARMRISHDRRGNVSVALVAEQLRQIDALGARVDSLAAAGILLTDGDWHRRLRESVFWGRGNTVHIWTGYLIRPRPGACVYLSASFNRRCATVVRECVFHDDAFVPLVLSMKLPQSKEPLWLRGEVACLLSVPTRARLTKKPIVKNLAVGHQFNEFFDASYWRRAGKKDAGRYRKLVAGETTQAAPTANCEFIHAGPDVLDIVPLARGVSAKGPNQTHNRNAPKAVVIRNLARVRGSWDGYVGVTAIDSIDRHKQALHRWWEGVYGAQTRVGLESMSGYVFGPKQGESVIQLRPWVFARTSPGWSLVVDGPQRVNIEGLRGVISTDVFHNIPLGIRLKAPGQFQIPARAPVGRLIPISRPMLRTTFECHALNDVGHLL